jgi:hypothetical protein
MSRPSAKLVTAVLVGLYLLPSVASAENFLEIGFDKRRVADTFSYQAVFSANKEEASTCKLTTPSGTYTCTEEDGAFYPELSFFDDHANLTAGELLDLLDGGWTLVWDEGLSTMTTATIDFGGFEESEFLPAPIITLPLDGSVGVDPATAIEWEYPDLDPCEAQLDYVIVCVCDPYEPFNCPDDEIVCTEELDDCNTTSYTPADSLDAGSNTVTVFNTDDVRDVPDGIIISGHAWVLDNTDWLGLTSSDASSFDVAVPVLELTWGVIKTLFH